jgi:hypothetical protein
MTPAQVRAALGPEGGPTPSRHSRSMDVCCVSGCRVSGRTTGAVAFSRRQPIDPSLTGGIEDGGGAGPVGQAGMDAEPPIPEGARPAARRTRPRRRTHPEEVAPRATRTQCSRISAVGPAGSTDSSRPAVSLPRATRRRTSTTPGPVPGTTSDRTRAEPRHRQLPVDADHRSHGGQDRCRDRTRARLPVGGVRGLGQARATQTDRDSGYPQRREDDMKSHRGPPRCTADLAAAPCESPASRTGLAIPGRNDTLSGRPGCPLVRDAAGALLADMSVQGRTVGSAGFRCCLPSARFS